MLMWAVDVGWMPLFRYGGRLAHLLALRTQGAELRQGMCRISDLA